MCAGWAASMSSSAAAGASCGVPSVPSASVPVPCGSAASIHAPFVRLSRETRELYLRGSSVAVLSRAPSPLQFYREHVSANLPALVRGAIDDWPALHKWRSNDYLRRTMGEQQLVSVACTPHGRADSVQDGVLMLPCEERWAFGRFMDYIERRADGPAAAAVEADGPVEAVGTAAADEGEVCYLQAQNASFSEFVPLHEDVGPLEWASVAFNDAPDAVNLWLGNERSLTTLHQDPYENIYAVVTGCKTFLLFPPTDLYWLDERSYPVGRYVRGTEGALQPRRDEQASDVPWVVDVEQQLTDMEHQQRLRHQLEDGPEEEAAQEADDSESGEWDRAPDEKTITEAMRRRYAKSAARSSRHTQRIV